MDKFKISIKSALLWARVVMDNRQGFGP